MSAFDEQNVFFSESFAAGETSRHDPKTFERQLYRREFKEFLRNFREREQLFTYRDQLKTNYNRGQYYIDVSIDDIRSHDDAQNRSEAQPQTTNYQRLTDQLKENPGQAIDLLEEAAKEVADEITRPRREGDEDMKDVQVLLHDDSMPQTIRAIQAANMGQLVKVSGIVISASNVRVKATHLTLQCRGCKSFLNNVIVRRGLEGLALPRKCAADVVGVPTRARCPIDPYFIVATRCRCVDMQVLKLQEPPEVTPSGETARHITLYCDRYLCDTATPGSRISAIGIYCIKRASLEKRGGQGTAQGVRQPYVRALGIDIVSGGASSRGGVSSEVTRHAIDKEIFYKALAARSDIAELISKSIAPSIYGLVEIKKAVACLLFGGSRKVLPDGIARRGDINVLLLGDPGTAKSQLLKFVEQCAPIAVYTSGKGSSAAGLTAAIVRDSARNFVVEGGAMVLADGGVICIDEFDKMREDDRVAIHEAMEQQTISIAKAGITTTLSSRCSVLAAANSVFGRWDDMKGGENIEFMPTILSRFDMIFIVRDDHNEQRDITLARHVISVHMNSSSSGQAAVIAGTVASRQQQWTVAAAQSLHELDLLTLKGFIEFCRHNCGPRLSPEAAEKLASRYVLMRNSAADYERETGRRISIPITVRQLEAVVRISESLARMRLAAFASEADVDEAIRLFHVSTMDAALTGSLAGAEGFTSEKDKDVLAEIERRIKQRFVVGSCLAQASLVGEMSGQHHFGEDAVNRVVQAMLRRGQLQYRLQRKLLYRVK